MAQTEPLKQEPALEHEPDFERPLDPRPRTPPRRNFLWPLVIVAALIFAGALVWRALHAPEPAVTPLPQAAAPQPSAPTTSGPKFPIEAATATPPQPTAPLPAVSDSDGIMQDALAALFTALPLDRVFYLQEIVPRFVATIDNLPRQTVALQRMPIKPVAGSFTVAPSDGWMLLRADNATRYETYMRVMEQADAHKLVQTYVRFYPLFQKAYEDLGYPHGYFNDRLVEVIDHLLAAPDVPAPIELTQPKVLYQFADPSLEQLSAGQKILIRMGPV